MKPKFEKTITSKDLADTLPDTSTPVRLKGLNQSVEIYRDRFGVPHVMAQTTHDAFFGQGFAAAQDRLWHMDYDRRRAYGRWAEFAGTAAVDQDKMMRRFGIGATVQGDYRAVNADTRAMLDAYSAGVNAFCESTDTLPVEYALVGGAPEPWRPWDCFAVYKVRHILMGVFEGKLWRARLLNALGPEKAADLLRGYPPGHLVIVPPGHEYEGGMLDGLNELRHGLQHLRWLSDDPDSGSNSWAVHGSRTASGKPLLAGDSHRLLDTPNAYYQNRIACPAFDVIGLSFPGCPGYPHFGHNAKVAWCVTHAGADYQDLYIERFSPDDPGKYEFEGAWLPAEVQREVIRVKDGPSEEITVSTTRHGPIIGGDPASGYGIAFKYTATESPYVGFESILEMMTAACADDIEASMRGWVDPCNNFLFADIHGDIGYLNRGRVPVRSAANAWLPVPGWTGEHEWEGDIPFERLARIRNPETGWIVTANNRIVDEDYPYYIGLSYVPEFRARRLLDRLKTVSKATVADMRGVHAECVSIPGKTFAKLLSEIHPPDDMCAEAKAVLDSWDGAMKKDAVAPALYSAFRIHLLRRIMDHHLGPLAEEMFSATGRGGPRHLNELAAWLVAMVRDNDTALLPAGSTWHSLAAEALGKGISYLTQRFGGDMANWKWGGMHRTRPKHPLSDAYPEAANLLDPPAVQMSGDGDTPLASGYLPGDPFSVTLLSVARYVFDLSDWDNSGWSVPLGVSGHPGSPHYADQTPVWSAVDLVPMTYDWDRVKADAESRQILEPV